MNADEQGRPQAEEPDGGAPSRFQAVLRFLRETVIILVFALVASVLLKTFLVQAFFIPSESMQNTLMVGDRLLVNKLAASEERLERGDIVVFVDPGGWLRPATTEPGPVQKALTWVGLLPQNAGEHLIKRIIGMPGDTVECCDEEGRILINGQPIDEPYLHPGAAPSNVEFSVTVPPAHMWLLGDNRSRSQDSRFSQGAVGGGFVPIRNVVGKAWVIVWPAQNISKLSTHAEVFDSVPDPQ